MMTIKERIKTCSTAGFFYMDNCRLNYSDVFGWYVKNFVDGKMETKNISEQEVDILLANHAALQIYPNKAAANAEVEDGTDT